MIRELIRQAQEALQDSLYKYLHPPRTQLRNSRGNIIRGRLRIT